MSYQRRRRIRQISIGNALISSPDPSENMVLQQVNGRGDRSSPFHSTIHKVDCTQANETNRLPTNAGTLERVSTETA
ncbi:uncharacterized protein N7525_003217 [Penicillium rubens]|uniref:uncharacterized protein n=1 Tax=Penicillium rubens TaxID=1108849 RepID=UPI002A59A651|nr:uncharacterized protein N7525_003217 [Penicillium rubens]KAJ5838029.1 hypothetical protein N7525_003217 [Penicillium rubens]